MIPRIKNIKTLDNYVLSVTFDDGYHVLCDVKEDINAIPQFKGLMEYGVFQQARLDTSRTCVYWNDKIDLASDTIREYGKPDAAYNTDDTTGMVAEDIA